MEACPQFNESTDFVGAAAISQARLFNTHPTGAALKRERLTALKVMYFWAETNHRVEHPVNLFLRRMADRPEVLEAIPLADFQACAKKMYARVYPLLGNLLGLRINNVDDVYLHLKTLR